ncbi:MAG: AAA family ATPase, partial [Janthinobacterium lividum]
MDQVLGLVQDLPGRGGALLVTGEPGIGKTTLLALGRQEAEAVGCVVVDVAGAAAERHLPFAGLQRLVHPLAADLAALPEPQRRALLLAVGDPRYEGDAPGLFVLGLALLELVGRAGRTRPVVLLVDDAQWLDPPTVEVLGFVARRLSTEAATLVLASREQSVPDPLTDLANLRLGPLDPDDARRVATDAAPALSDAQVLHVLEVAAGNPLALQELGRLAASGAAADAGDEGPLTERLERAFGAGSSALPAATRALLLVMAVADGGDYADAVAVAARLAGPLGPDETL